MANGKTKGGGPHNFRGGSVYHGRKAASKKVNDENLLEWRGLSPKDQLQALDSRLGKGVGAVKQRKRIQALLDALPPEEAKPKKAKKAAQAS